MSLFQTCILTTSTPKQADIYQKLIQKRLEHGLYPQEIDFRVYSDPEAGAVGSGGATLLALHRYMQETGSSGTDEKRLLIIHAGGKKQQIPSFTPEGILFSPVPVTTSSIIPPVVLDLQLSMFLRYPWNNGEVIISSGNVIIDFDTGALNEARGDICGFATPAPFQHGTSHGVFKFDQFRHNVINYYQKAQEEFLRTEATLEGTQKCALDTGILSFSQKFADSFLQIGNLRAGNKTILQNLQDGNCSFDLYLEIMTAALAGITYNTFNNRVALRSGLQEETLRAVYEHISAFNLTALLTRSTSFHHVISMRDYFHACLELNQKEMQTFYSSDYDEIRGVNRPDQIAFNCIDLNLPLGRHKRVIAEGVQDCTLENTLGHNLLIGITHWSSDIVIPEEICIEERKIGTGNVRIVYGLNDTFYPQQSCHTLLFCGVPMEHWLSSRALNPHDLWAPNEEYDLTTARLFCADPSDSFLSGYWAVPNGTSWSEQFRLEKRYSFLELTLFTDAIQRDNRRQMIRTQMLRRQIVAGIGWNSISLKDFVASFSENPPRDSLKHMYQSTHDFLLRQYRKRLLEELCEKEIGDDNVTPEIHFSSQPEPVSKFGPGIGPDRMIIAESPVRMDLAGGWTDTPPFTYRNGGAIVNFAMDLHGKPSVTVFCKPGTEQVIRLVSIDKGESVVINSTEELENCKRSDTFGISATAVSLFCVSKNRPVERFLSELKGGFVITTVSGVPRGAGLGASSILTATVLASLYRLFGRETTRDQLLQAVLELERIRFFDGGWQDTSGGVIGGLKYIQSKPGLHPEPVIHQLDPFLFNDRTSLAYFTLYDTGIRRSVPSIIKEVSSAMNSSVPAFLFTLKLLKQLAADARNAIEMRDLHFLGKVINEVSKANIRIHQSATNTQFEELLAGARSYYCAAKCAGAGGGGYALFLSESPAQAIKLQQYLAQNGPSDGRIVPFSLNERGLQVTLI